MIGCVSLLITMLLLFTYFALVEGVLTLVVAAFAYRVIVNSPQTYVPLSSQQNSSR